ncbi:glycosyltransferase family 4 protein [Hwanghaeella sp.]|uniref:glycosyltransferase family 4 protein n=1 Tax=Hwanghaeella sp. TaxID=2605943 RepID=UPI003CCBC3BE
MTTAFVLKGYPRLSETFIAQEILALERRGLDIVIVSLRHPTDRHSHPVHAEISAPVIYLPEYLYQEPRRVLHAWWAVRDRKGYAAARNLWFKDLRRDRTPNRIRRFGQALVLAAELEGRIDRLHFHFLHTPASVTRYAAMILDVPWSGSAHAKDIWTIPDWEKREKLAAMDWLSTCTGVGAEHLRHLAEPNPQKVHLDYHGLDLTRFPHSSTDPSGRDGSDPSDPVRLISVGRAVAKKGYPDLLNALAKIPNGLHWRLTHIGGGTERDSLKALAGNLGIADNVDWLGAQPQQAVLDHLRQSDLFVLASKIAEDGDRDGLPNVLMEAQSQRLAVLSTAVSAVPELILDGETGALVQPGDVPALTAALTQLIADPDLRRRYGEAGEARVRSRFDAASCIAGMAQRFGLPAGPDQQAASPAKNADACG